MTASKHWSPVLAVLLLLCAIPASASPVTFFFTGHVNSEAINGCGSAPLPQPAGPVTVSETIPAGVIVTAITATPPAALVGINPGAGTATVTVTAAALTTVTFTDALIVNTAVLQIARSPGLASRQAQTSLLLLMESQSPLRPALAVR